MKSVLAICLTLVGSATMAADPLPSAADQEASAKALADCVVRKSTGEDRIAVAQWMLVAMASAPQMANIVKIEPSRKADADKRMAAVFTRLMVEACPDQSRLLFKANNDAGFEAAGGALGEIAVQELLSNPAATRELEAYSRYLKPSDFTSVTK